MARCTAALFACSLLFAISCRADEVRINRVLVIKSDRTMYLLADGRIVRTFHIALGSHPVGDKRREGDGRTPEGTYILDFKNSHSAYYKSIHISYPNLEDRLRARRNGVDPGNDIMIHGQRNGYRRFAAYTQRFDWTEGCIAVSDHDMDEIWRLVKVGTPIDIEP